jgi:DNA gyrase subunit B
VFQRFFIYRRTKEYIRYLDGNREPIIAHVISMDNEREILVEVALYNTSYQKIFFLCNNINTHEGHLQGFRTGLTRSLKKYADASGMLDT